MDRYCLFFLFLVSGFLLLVVLILVINYGKLNCKTFLGGQRNNEMVGCGFGRSPLIEFDNTIEKAFVGYGVARGVRYKNDKMMLDLAIPWGKVFSFRVEVELSKRPNGKYDICREKLKRWGLFDCSGILKFTKEDVLRVSNEIKNREIIFLYNNKKSDKYTENWVEVLKKKNIFDYFFLTVKGLFYQNKLYAYMVGY